MSEDTLKTKSIDGGIPDPEVGADKPKTKRRRNLTTNYKLRILAEADQCQGNPGELGALLRREGLYSSHLNTWRRDRNQGKLSATSKTKRGPKQKLSDSESEVLELRQENEELKLKYHQAQKLIEAQKKIAELYETAAREAGLPKKRPEKS